MAVVADIPVKRKPTSGGNVCAVWGCKHSTGKIGIWNSQECEAHLGMLHKNCPCRAPYSIYSFPKDVELRKLWLTVIDREDYTPKPSSKVCSIHFVDGKPTPSNPMPTLFLGHRVNKEANKTSFRCSVRGCNNSYRKIREWTTSECLIHPGLLRMNCQCISPYRLHKFPTDDHLRLQWEAAIKRKHTSISRVCSDHFVDGKPSEQNPIPVLHLDLCADDRNENCEEVEEGGASQKKGKKKMKRKVKIVSGVRACVVHGCKNSYQKIHEWKTANCEVHPGLQHKDCRCPRPYQMHGFPQEADHRKQWEIAINKKWDRYSRICSVHFVDARPTKQNPVPELNLGPGLTKEVNKTSQPSKFQVRYRPDIKPSADAKRNRYRFSGSGACVVVGCPNGYGKLYKWKNSNCDVHPGLLHIQCRCPQPYGMHVFPKDEALKSQWDMAINRKPNNHSIITRICSLHFVDGGPTKQNPIPELFLGHTEEDCVGDCIEAPKPNPPKRKRKPKRQQPIRSRATCLVDGCNNTYGKIEKWKIEECDIHPDLQHQDCRCPFPYQLVPFPKDLERQRQWERAINKKSNKFSYICSLHFVDGKPTKQNPHPELLLGDTSTKEVKCHMDRQKRKQPIRNGATCLVDGCNNSQGKIEKWKITDCNIHPGLQHSDCGCIFLDYQLHMFPQDADQQKEWERAINKKSNKFSYICSLHFVEGGPTKQNPNPELLLGDMSTKEVVKRFGSSKCGSVRETRGSKPRNVEQKLSEDGGPSKESPNPELSIGETGEDEVENSSQSSHRGCLRGSYRRGRKQNVAEKVVSTCQLRKRARSSGPVARSKRKAAQVVEADVQFEYDERILPEQSPHHFDVDDPNEDPIHLRSRRQSYSSKRNLMTTSGPKMVHSKPPCEMDSTSVNQSLPEEHDETFKRLPDGYVDALLGTMCTVKLEPL